jgi:uncharacterized protein (DUF952 family)
MAQPYLYHLAVAGDWDPARAEYRGSTLGRTLEEEGFVHCSTPGRSRTRPTASTGAGRTWCCSPSTRPG